MTTIHRTAVCLLAAAFLSASQPSSHAAPVMPLSLRGGEFPELAQRIENAAMRQARYLLSLLRPWEGNPEFKLLTDSKSGEHWIRPNTGTAAGLAFLHRFSDYNGEIIGLSREALLDEAIIPMMRYLAATHLTGPAVTGDGKPWGHAWQSAHWAYMLGRGAWWIWDDLPEDLREGVRRVIRDEAERIANAEPVFQIEYDTKSEENAWNAQILSIAVLLMPDDPRRPEWERQFQRWVLNSFLRPADAESETVVDGKPVSEQFLGATIYDDFTLENHGIVHPSYMQCYGLTLHCALDYLMTDRKPPEALYYNVQGLYNNLKWFSLPDGGYVYPSGQDWELFRQPRNVTPHALMAVFGGDPDGGALMLSALDTLERMQARHESGQIFADNETFFPSNQTDMLYSLAQCWLTLRYADGIRGLWTPPEGVLLLDNGKILLNRFADSIHTLGWGKTIMAQFVPNALDRVVSPDLRNGVGEVAITGGGDPLPLSLQSAEIETRRNGFTADLVYHHGDAVRAALRAVSNPDGSMEWSETLTALRDIETAFIQTGLIGVLNNPNWIHETGRRAIRFETAAGAAETFTAEALGGAKRNMDGAAMVNVDGKIVIEAESPLRCAYLGAEKSVRGRATDRLYLNRIDEAREWSAGDVLTRYKAIIRSGL